MSVLLETSLGDIVIDLHVQLAPNASRNFLKLCKLKYYNYSLFHNVQPGSLIQSGDPTGTGTGGQSVYGILYGEQARFFEHEVSRALRHDKPGVVSMAAHGPCTNGSQFFITVDGPQEHLDDKYTIFGQVAEGLDVAVAISKVYADSDGRPYKNVRIRHTIILDDPFDDPPGLEVPDESPPPSDIVLQQDRERLADYEDVDADAATGRTAEEVEEELKAKAAKSRAEVLEMLGDLPDADIEPPKNVLFVCKLNPVTEDEDLDIIFGRFGNILSCEVIRDPKTGDSLNYAFIEFETEDACTQAYFKMDGALIDDRRIHVDFSQSVSHLWNKRRRKEEMPAYDSAGGGGGAWAPSAHVPVGSSDSGPRAPQRREGDWVCAQCNANVFASKQKCFRCGAAKGREAPMPRDDNADDRGRGERERREGERARRDHREGREQHGEPHGHASHRDDNKERHERKHKKEKREKKHETRENKDRPRKGRDESRSRSSGSLSSDCRGPRWDRDDHQRRDDGSSRRRHEGDSSRGRGAERGRGRDCSKDRPLRRDERSSSRDRSRERGRARDRSRERAWRRDDRFAGRDRSRDRYR